jgi:hypothetical protein
MDGLSVKRFCEILSHVKEPEIRHALTFLTDEGHLFTTIGNLVVVPLLILYADDEHFAATGEDF